MGAGVVLRQWSIVLLGQFFTVDIRVHAGQTVVDRGPYRWLRHPSYTGLIVTLLGLGLALGNWAAPALAVVVPIAGLVVRIRAEERVLLANLGEPYRRPPDPGRLATAPLRGSRAGCPDQARHPLRGRCAPDAAARGPGRRGRSPGPGHRRRGSACPARWDRRAGGA